MMMTRKLKEIIKGTLGIAIITGLGIIFFMISSLNKATEAEIYKGKEFVEIISESFNDELLNYRISLDRFSSSATTHEIVQLMNQNPSKASEYSNLFSQHTSLYFQNNDGIRSVLIQLLDGQEKVSAFWDNEDVYLNDAVEWPIDWLKDENGLYKYEILNHNSEDVLVLKVKKIDPNTKLIFESTMVIALNQFVGEFWQKFDYQVNLIHKDLQVYFDDPKALLKDHLESLEVKKINQKKFFTLDEKNVSIEDLNYNHQRLFFMYPLSDDYYLTLIKPYDKISLVNIENEVFTHILVYMLMGIGILGFLIFNHEKTTKWIEKDRVFLNEIIDLNKIQISEFKKDLAFYQVMMNENPLPIFVIDKHSLNIIGVNNKVVDFYGYTEEELLQMSLSDVCQWEDDHGDHEVIDIIHTKSNQEKEVGGIRLQEIIFNENEMLMVLIELNHDKFSNGFYDEKVDEVKSEKSTDCLIGEDQGQEGTNKENTKHAILVLDNHEDGSHLKDMLEENIACTVKLLTNEIQVFSEINKNNYDLLFIAEALKKFNGHDIITLIKNSDEKRLRQLPILLMTSDDIEVNEDFQVITKPLKHEELVEVIEKMFAKQLLLPYLNVEVIDATIFCETYESLGLEILQALIDKFFLTSSGIIEEMDLKLEKKDYKGISAQLHKLKGSMSYFGSKKCQSMFFELEKLSKANDSGLINVYEVFKKEFDIFIEALITIKEKMNELLIKNT